MARRKGFFTREVRPEDELARARDVEALVAPRRAIIQDIPVDRIYPNPFQARRTFDDLEELAVTIRTQGFTTRLRVRAHPAEIGMFQLVFGERRLRAARLADLTEVPCEIADHTDEELIEIGLAENIQRRDLTPLEEAQAFQMLITQRDYSIRRLAERIGKDKSYVEDRLVLLRTPEDVQHMVAQRPDSLRSAREIARLDSPEARRPLIEGIVAGTLTTADVRALVREATEPDAQDPSLGINPPRSLGINPQATPNPQRILERDLRTISAIVDRWQTLHNQGEAEHVMVFEATARLLQATERLLHALHGGETPPEA